MEKTIAAIHDMYNEGIVTHYAIGGAIASMFYTEPVVTYDLDVFVLLPDSGSVLISLSPIYEWLSIRGYHPHQEQIIVEGIPVQFIPAYNDLIIEAVTQAVEKIYNGLRTYVLLPEYLMAIMIQTFRPKDKERLKKFLDDQVFQEELFNIILMKHNLMERYLAFIKA
jgi:hypothetical protein